MGYKDKKRIKDLHQQAYDRLTGMQAFGQSKKDAIADGTVRDKIFSYTTYKTYWQQTKAFVKYVLMEHPKDCRNLKQARRFATEWLKKNEREGKSASTLHTQAAALRKLFSMKPGDKDYYKPPTRRREDITRSRLDRVSDKHFSKSNNAALIKFCRGLGPRREGLSKLRGKDLMTRSQIRQEFERLNGLAKTRTLTKEETTALRISKDALLFYKSEYFCYLREKGGRERISPIVGPDVDEIVERFRSTAPDDKVWLHIHSNADIHGYRSDYANRIYKDYARPIEDIPYDKVNKGTGRKYQSEVYHCRNDEAGKDLDKYAMLLASKALGHNRLDVVANNYLRGL